MRPQIPSLALMILRRAQTVGAPWSQLDAEGSRYTDAARILVAQGLCEIERRPFRFLKVTKAGLELLAMRDRK